ncbi:Myotubularin-related 14 [Paramuricea clavata]|uniref:Myotubularin-related 14 n=1 Tax=Paramuricea clavata TaxID=317549 RepID=A0A6S7HE56_PARCT|nr:Myotubularin-related 14 [Paramuricea clavata]
MVNVYPEKPFHFSRTRRTELNKIESFISSMPDDENVVRTVYLTGQPGSGKTELARQYGEQFENASSASDTSKHLVITLNANSEDSLMKSVKEAARKLRLPVCMELTNKNLEELMENLRDYFRDYSGAWLLIIDDMFGKNDFNKLFPRPGVKDWGGGQVLVTTQDNNLVPAGHLFAKPISLNEGMTKEDALALLKEISDVEVDDFAEEIIKELQSLPLALACCATYVGETRQDRASTQFGWKEFLNLYRENAKLESRSFFNNNVYPLSMKAATAMAVKRMAETSDVLRLTFSFLSYCELLPVPLIVLAHHVMENLPVQNDKRPTTKEEIKNEISRCTLLVHGRLQNVETIQCHQVIHNAFESAGNEKPEFVKMMKSLNESLDFMVNTHKEDVLFKVLVRPHLKSFVDHANDMSWNDTAEFLLISMKDGQFLFSTSNMPDESAVRSLELLYKISLELDLSDESRCDILANLGFYYLELGRDEDALNFLCKAYFMTEGKSEKEWLLLKCRVSCNLARTYFSMDSLDLAVEMMKRSIDLAKDVYIKEEDKVMNRFCWLAHFYCFSMRFWKLGAVVEEAAEFFSSCAPDIESVSRARCLNYLSGVYVFGIIESTFKPWKYRKYMNLAENILNKSVKIYEEVLEADVFPSPEYCFLLAWCAIFKLEAEKPIEARTQLDKALEYCLRNGDRSSYSWIAAFKKHLCGNSSWWQSLFYRILNLTKGRVTFAEHINICDDILRHCNTGLISPSRQMINGIKRGRDFFIWYNYAIFSLIFYYFFCLP